MIKIPEELLKLTDKQLQKILTSSSYTNRYLYSRETLYKVEKKFGILAILRNLDNNRILSISLNNVEPFTYKKFKEVKADKLRTILNNCSNETFAKYLDNIVSQVIDKDRYDITIDQRNNKIHLVLYYPEITITNSHELSHTMKDIYVRFSFDDNNISAGFRTLNRMSMCRTTFTDKEWISRYTFSHFNHNELTKYSGSFCFGDTELAISKRLLSQGKFSSLQQVILSFEEYLSWESLEGTPYQYISNLSSNNPKYTISNRSMASFTELNKIYSKMIYQFEDLTYNYDLKDGIYRVKLNPDSIDKIEDYLTINNPKYNYFLIDGKSYELNDSYIKIKLTKEESKSEVVFKGEPKTITIINTETVEEVEPSKRIHRSILDYVVSKLESKFNLYLINAKLEEIYE